MRVRPHQARREEVVITRPAFATWAELITARFESQLVRCVLGHLTSRGRSSVWSVKRGTVALICDRHLQVAMRAVAR